MATKSCPFVDKGGCRFTHDERTKERLERGPGGVASRLERNLYTTLIYSCDKKAFVCFSIHWKPQKRKNVYFEHSHMLAKLLVTFRARKVYWILASNSMELPNDRNEQENAVEVTWSYENDVWLSTLDSNGMKCLLDINRFMIKSRNGVSIA